MDDYTKDKVGKTGSSLQKLEKELDDLEKKAREELGKITSGNQTPVPSIEPVSAPITQPETFSQTNQEQPQTEVPQKNVEQDQSFLQSPLEKIDHVIPSPQGGNVEPKQPKSKWPYILLSIFLILLIGVVYLSGKSRAGDRELLEKTPGVTPFYMPSPTPEEELTWTQYMDPKGAYTFKYPEGLAKDTGTAGVGVESIRVTYEGESQIKEGSETVDGYSFTVTKIGSAKSQSLEKRAEDSQTATKKGCVEIDGFLTSQIKENKIAKTEALTYEVVNCLGDYSINFVADNSFVYMITQSYFGEKKADYKLKTQKILDTFEFVALVTSSPTPTSNASPTPTPKVSPTPKATPNATP